MSNANQNNQGLSLVVNRAELISALELAAFVCKNRDPRPVLAFCLLTADESGLSVSATDMERYAKRNTAKVQVIATGKVLVKPSELLPWVKAVSGDTVSVELKDTMLLVKSKSASAKFPTSNVENYPPTPEDDYPHAFDVSSENLVRAIGAVAWATNSSPDKVAQRFLSAVNLEWSENNLTTVGTEGHVIGAFEVPLEGVAQPGSAMLPFAVADTIRRAFSDSGGTLSVDTGDGRISVDDGETRIVAGLNEGSYPPWKQYLSGESAASFEIEASELSSAFTVAAMPTLAEGEDSAVAMKANSRGVQFSSRSRSSGEASAQIACRVDGEINVGLIPRQMRPALSCLPSKDVVSVRIANKSQPIVMKSGRQTVFVSTRAIPVDLQ